MLNNSETPPQSDPSLEAEPLVMTVEEVAVLLRVNKKTVYDAIKRREFPGVRRIGGTIRVARAAVLRWLEEGQGSARTSRGSR